MADAPSTDGQEDHSSDLGDGILAELKRSAEYMKANTPKWKLIVNGVWLILAVWAALNLIVWKKPFLGLSPFALHALIWIPGIILTILDWRIFYVIQFGQDEEK